MRQLLFEWEEEEKKKKNYEIRSPFSCLLVCGSIARLQLIEYANHSQLPLLPPNGGASTRAFPHCSMPQGLRGVSAPRAQQQTYIQNMDIPVVTEEKK